MSNRRPHRNLPQTLVVGTIMLLAIAVRLLPGPRTVDDAYITFRYARNLISGQGFVYNAGEQVLGTTTPLYTLLMASLALLTGSRDFPTLALVINAMIGSVSVGLLYALSKRFSNHWAPAAATALLWTVAPYSVTFAIGGMETELTVALLLATAYAHLTGHPRVMALLSALALLVRPDTAILVGLLWLDLTLAQRRVPWREGLITLAILAPWLIFGTLYFGSPFTTSIAAKSVTYRLPPDAGFVRLLQHYATPFFEHKILPSIGVFVVFVLYFGLCMLGSLSALRRERRTWPLIAYPFAYFAVFAAANPLLFRWYLSPPLPFYFLLILTGVWTLARNLNGALSNLMSGTKELQTISLAVFTVYAALALTLTLNAWDLHPDHGPDRPAPEMAWFKLELLYEQASNIVLSHTVDLPSERITLCAGDIGMLGYHTDMHILDTVGLVTRQSREYYPTSPSIYVINYAIPADLVLALDPDYIVILEVYGRVGLLPHPGFQAQYQLLEKLETDIYGSDGMLIFVRR
jgi:arabinofuranosyltransferase